MKQPMLSDGTPVPAATFTDAVSRSHISIAKIDVGINHQFLYSAGVSAGSVTWDRKAAVRARCSVTVPASQVGSLVQAFMSPAGYEVQLWRGVALPAVYAYTAHTDYLTGGGDYLTTDIGELLVAGADTTSFGATTPRVDAWVSLGVYGIQEVTLDDVGDGPVTRIEGDDLSRKIADATLTDAVEWTTADTLESKIEDLVLDAVPYLTFSPSGATHAAPAVVHELGADRWDIILEAAKAVGYEVYVDAYTVRWRPEPDLRSAVAVATIAEGVNWGTGQVSMSRDPAFNAWTVIGSNADNDTEYTATVYDDDPTSLTYYYGPFGKKPARPERLDQVDTQAKADAAAAGLKAAATGIGRVIEVETWPNPTLEPGDAIVLTRSPLEVDEVALIDEMRMGLLADDGMTLTCRTKLAE